MCVECINISNNSHFAVKIYKRHSECNNQIEILKKATAKRLPGVPHLVEVLTDSMWLYVVMELIDGVNLLDYLHKTELTGKTVFNAFNALWKIVTGIHSLKFVHGRLCFKNIYVLNNLSDYRLIGFSNAKPIVDINDKEIDYWAIGVCLYTVLCGQSPFDISNLKEAKISIIGNNFNQKCHQWTTLNKATRDVIYQLICGSRPTRNRNSPNLKSIIKQSLQHSINNSIELINENVQIISIRAGNVHDTELTSDSIEQSDGNEQIISIREENVHESSVNETQRMLHSIEQIDENEQSTSIGAEIAHECSVNEIELTPDLIQQTDEDQITSTRAENAHECSVNETELTPESIEQIDKNDQIISIRAQNVHDIVNETELKPNSNSTMIMMNGNNSTESLENTINVKRENHSDLEESQIDNANVNGHAKRSHKRRAPKTLAVTKVEITRETTITLATRRLQSKEMNKPRALRKKLPVRYNFNLNKKLRRDIALLQLKIKKESPKYVERTSPKKKTGIPNPPLTNSPSRKSIKRHLDFKNTPSKRSKIAKETPTKNNKVHDKKFVDKASTACIPDMYRPKPDHRICRNYCFERFDYY